MLTSLTGSFAIHPDYRKPLSQACLLLTGLAMLLLFVRVMPQVPGINGIPYFVPMHTGLEMGAIIVSVLIFVIGWESAHFSSSTTTLIVALGFLGVGLLDLAHVLSFPGMPDFITPNSPGKAINFWLLARFFAALALLTAALQLCRFELSARSRQYLLCAVIVLVAALCWIILFRQQWIAPTYIPGQGLTAFKVRCEYGLFALYVLCAVISLARMRDPLSINAVGIFAAAGISALSEYYFVLYNDVTDIYNFLGHVYKIIAYGILYRAIFVRRFIDPYQQLVGSEAELAEERNKLSTILDSVEAYIYIKDREFRYQYANRKVCELFGRPLSGVIGKTDDCFFNTETADNLLLNDQKVIQLGERLEAEEINTVKGGQQASTFLSVKIPLRASDGHIYGLCGISTDISRQKQLLTELSEAYELIKESQIIAGLGDYVLDITTGIWKSSEFLDQIFGIEQDYVRTIASWLALIHPDDQAMMAEHLNQHVLGQRLPFDKEYRVVRHADGAVRWVHGKGRLSFDTEGAPCRMQGTIQDITTRKEVDATLVKLSLAVEQSPSSIIITDLNGQIEYVNAAFQQVTGYELNEVLGKNPRIWQSGKTSAATYSQMWQYLHAGKVWRGELTNKRKNGEEYIEDAIISPVRSADGRITHYLAIKEDITAKKLAEQRLEYMGRHDLLTGLPNRFQMAEHFNYLLTLAQRNRGKLSVMFLDLDRFKDINDSLGHSVGDELLKAVAARLKNMVRKQDVVSRLGGDEFIFLLPDTDEYGAAQVAGKLLRELCRPYGINGYELTINASIGIAVYPNDGRDVEDLLRSADSAMYLVKQQGRNGFGFYTREMQETSSRRLMLGNALRKAIPEDQLSLHYQPQVNIASGKIVGAEALLRWQHPRLGSIPPDEFIPIAEDTGQIIALGDWVLKTAVGQLKSWQAQGLDELVVAINLSAAQFRKPDLFAMVESTLRECGVSPQFVELELTEAVAMSDPQRAVAIMQHFYEQGISIAIDDFGTGYSSLSYLKRFKVKKLKIDKSFIHELETDCDDQIIVKATINLANSLGITTIAEGVETRKQLELLGFWGCDEFQGYLFSRPLPAEQFFSFCAQQRHRD